MQSKSQPLKSKKMQIGQYSIHPLPTGIFGLDGGAMFGTVPRTLWEKTNPPDDHNRIELEARALLLLSPNRKILIDVGLGGDFVEKYGEKLGSKFAEIFAVTATKDRLEQSLAKHGLSLLDITDVVLTHLHFDHAGGSTKFENGRLVPSFPKATYYLQRANLETAQKPNLRERASYFEANFKPLLEAGCLKLLDGDVNNLFDSVNVFVTNGHTRGQQLVEIHDSNTRLIYCGDIVPTSSHVRLPFVMGYDLNPLMVIEEKRQILSRIANGKGYIYFEHDPYCDAAAVESAGEDFKVAEMLRL